MKKFKLNLNEDFVSLKNNAKDFKNPLLREASISLANHEVTNIGGTAFTQSHSKSYNQYHSKTTSTSFELEP